MKLRLFLPSVIFLFCGLISRAQVSEMIYQGFEEGETVLFSVTPTTAANYSTTYQMSGSRSLELQQNSTEDVTLLISEIDFTQNTSLHYISLQFDHICKVPANQGDPYMCRLYYKRVDESDNSWHQLTSVHYNMTDGGSQSFNNLGSFSNNTYLSWLNDPLSNDLWKSERFDLNDVMTAQVPANQRKLMLKFVMKKKTGSGAATGKWLIDNLKVTASSSPMVRPVIKMIHYPELMDYPNSRGANIVMAPSTTLSAGINPDSVYLFYRVGSNPTPVRVDMEPVVGHAGQYSAHIPFFGYDTLMYFYCVARDATTNANMVTFPAADNSWVTYRCVRGVEQPGVLTPGFTGTTSYNYFPFYLNATQRSEWVYDSALLAEAGYGPGSMVAMRFTFATHTNTVSRNRLQVKMKNVPTNYTPDLSVADHYPFTLSFMHVVYDSAYTINEANAGMEQTLQFQDTFYYAGKDIVMQLTYANPTDMTTTSIKMIPALSGKPSNYSLEGEAEYGVNPFTSSNMDEGGYAPLYRPALVMTQRKNLPLLYDMGFVTDPSSSEYGLVTPNYDVPMTTGDHRIQVKLKNWGALTANAITISYSIDGGAPVHRNWIKNSGLAGGATDLVTLESNLPLVAGFHTLRVWVEDSLTAAGQSYRDHEPYNDTIFSEFVVCDGPMNNVRNIGGTNADFATLEEFLYAVSRCGIDDSLVVRLAPGSYERFTMPSVNGLTTNHYIVFEPQNNGEVAFYVNGEAASIVNLESANNIRFRNIRFERRGGALTDMVLLGQNSHGCHFENCVFVDSISNPAASMRINSMINTGFSNGLVVDGCTFVGGKVGVDLKGMALDLLSLNNSVNRSVFRNQYENAVKVQNQENVEIHGNEMYNVLSASSYVLLVDGMKGSSRISANKIYTSHGAGGIGVSNAVGTSAVRLLIANNMLVGDDDGSANQMRTLMNIIQASWTDVVYNSMKMTASSRTNIATATFGSGTVQNSRFMNNIVVCLDRTNYAFNYASGYESNNTVGHNVYYALNTTMNKRGGIGYGDMTNWSAVETADTNSISTNPNFLNGSLVDLRTYNRLIKGVGMPIASVPTDMFDTLRSTTATCPGAFEFVSLGYDFEPEALVSPEMVTCYMPSNVELKVLLRNSGTSTYMGSGLTIAYQVNGGTVHTVAVTDTIPAEDTVTIATGQTLNLPADMVNALDVAYNLRVWTSYANDPNATNDTNNFIVVSKYHPAAPSNVTVSIDYAEPAVVTPTVGVNDWKVYTSTAAPRRPSQLYWYYDTTDAAPFYVGGSLTTDTLRTDTMFYFRQKRDLPIVRITQVEIKRGGSGANVTIGETPNAPFWLNSSRKVALQLTNIGDAPANLEGDTLRSLIATTSNSGGNVSVKDFVFGNVTIAPGASLVVQTANGTSSNPSLTIHTGAPLSGVTVNYNTHAAFIYKRGGVVEDAVALNDVTTTALTKPGNWNQQQVPSYVWMGGGIVMPSTAPNKNTAGIVRTSFNSTQTRNDWRIATNDDPMMISSVDESWIRYTDNGCDGLFATATVSMIAPPAADISMGVPQLPASSCGLGMEEVSVRVNNYGIQPVSGLVLNYCAGGDTVTEIVPATIGANSYINYTFTGRLNLAFDHDSLVTVRVWADSVAGDPMHVNDTNSATVMSLYTPDAPAAIDTHFVSYATRDTVSITAPAGLIPVWYDYDGNRVDTGYSNISEILYVGGNRGVSYMIFDTSNAIVGTGTSTNNNAEYPSPYQPNNKFAKQQFIYSASELRAGGLQPGYIDSVAFELKQIVGSTSAISFDEYTLSMGLVDDTIFASTSDWKSVSQVYSRTPMTITQADCNHWVTHQLDVPFYWDGESSVVVQVLHRINTPVTTGVKSAYTAKNNTTLVKNANTEPAPSLEEYVAVGTKGNKRPNIRINNTSYGCESPVTPYAIHMINTPLVDLTVLWPNGVDTIEYNSCDSIPIYVNVRNQGSSVANNTKLYYYYDAMPVDSTIVTASIAPSVTQNVQLLKRPMMPGRHSITVVVAGEGDSITSNDTISRSFMVRFCSGSYTIALTGGDYSSFGEAIDTLNVVGVEGPVTFVVQPGTYNEQVILNNIPGSSSTNTITFVGSGDADDVLLTAPTSQNDNYVFYLDSASNVSLMNFRIEARPTASGNAGNYANALVIRSGDNINVSLCTIRVKGTINNVNASCVVLSGYINNFNFTNNTVDSGYVSMRTSGTPSILNLNVNNNVFKNFWSQGVNLRGITNLSVNSNEITSGVTISGRGLTGLYLAQTAGTFNVKKNKIYLIDNMTGGKRGIQLENINCSATAPGLISNNMVSCYGTGTQGLTPAKPSGIWIDSSSTNVNVYFNTVRVFCGPNANAAYSDASYSFFSGASVSNIKVSSNIFSNFSKGYAYYVSELNTVTLSNNNAYYSVSNRPFAWKQTTIATLSALQNLNGNDANSVFDEPYFVANDDLHLVMTNFVSLADYSSDVPDDIDGDVRMEVPAPTIGADEMNVFTHDMAVVGIIEPIMPTNFNFNPPSNMPPNIESDSVRVIAKFYNNGRSTETNVQWYAYIHGEYDSTYSGLVNIGTFSPGEMKTDTLMMPTVLGITDTHTVHVVVVIPVDSNLSNNDRTTPIYLAPAYDFAITKVQPTSTGCDLTSTTVRITVKNNGFKDIPANTTLTIGYQPEITQFTPTQPSGTTVPTLPGVREEIATIASTLFMGQTTNLDFVTPANFYPTGLAANLKIRLVGWVNYVHDVTHTNDTTVRTNSSQSVIFDSYYTPEAPYGHDVTVAYGTWGTVTAEQANNRPIRWYRDSTAAPFYSPSLYATSCIWNNTPQYFADSTYYLNCLSDKNCPSHFSEVHVTVEALIANDMAFLSVQAPLGNRVYMENDTVRVSIVNYGTASQTNVPVTYELKRGGTVLQTVTEFCTATIASGQSYTYTFDRLLDIPTPTQTQNYSLNIWTDLPSDDVRRNDTIRVPYTFRSLAENTYVTSQPGSPSFDVTRVSYNEIDLDIPPLGRGFTDLATYNAPEYPAAHLTRGTTDSLIVEVTSLDQEARDVRYRMWAFVDFDRSGTFSNDEIVVNGESFYGNEVVKNPVTISNNASYGYMRMRIVVGLYSDYSAGATPPFDGIPSNKDGHNLDFLLFVNADAPATDVAVTQIVNPRSYLIRDDLPKEVSFRFANKGTQPLTNPSFHYRFDSPSAVSDSTNMGTVTFPGTLQPGTSGIVTLPEHSFPIGTSQLTIWSSAEGDYNRNNDTLHQEYNRFHVVTLILDDDFESDDDMWYAPTGFNAFSRNYWQKGTPTKTKINAAYSGENAWVTDLNSTIVTGKRGNVSYLYSPIINISQIRPDTLSFRLRRNIINGSSLRLEFYNFENRWVNVNADSLTNWYNNTDDKCFDASSAGSDYNYYWIPTSKISGDFPERLQFRFVYSTPLTTSATSSFGEGCAVDNFHIGRDRRPKDAGVVAITQPTAPAYGQTICPEVVVHNFGTDTIRSIKIGYTTYGNNLPQENTFTCLLPPNGEQSFLFTSSFPITNRFPDTFAITAFTELDQDIYYDNDTTTRIYGLSPLEHDIAANSLLYPLDNAVAGDSLQVTLRVRNFGRSPINTATAVYTVNGDNRVEEDIDFVAILGHGLPSMEYFNYTFHQKFRAGMGVMKIVASVNSPQNDYIYNDTVSKRVEAINSVTDIAAAAIIVDTSSFNEVRFSLIIENRGARAVNGFEVGFYIDGDSINHMHREVYGRSLPLPALTTGYYQFDATYLPRSSRYTNVTGFVHIEGDNDSSNDTTNLIAGWTLDLEAVKVIVVENAQPDCNVFFQVKNTGNISLLTGSIHADANINGVHLVQNFQLNSPGIVAGQTKTYLFEHRIPKSPTRNYTGNLIVSHPSDSDPNNNQTNFVEVRGYMGDAPLVEADEFTLDQNYPNPFTGITTIPFSLPNDAEVRFFVVDAMGHVVNSFSRHFEAGNQSINLDLSAYSAGVYYYGIEVDGQRRMKKMIMR